MKKNNEDDLVDSLSPKNDLGSSVETIQMRRAWLPEEIHRPKQFEEACEESFTRGTRAGHGFGKSTICNF